MSDKKVDAQRLEGRIADAKSGAAVHVTPEEMSYILSNAPVDAESPRGKILKDALDATLRSRHEMYGDPFKDMQCASEFFDMYKRHAGGKYHPAHDEAIKRVCMKLARIAVGAPGIADNYTDAAAYLAIAYECEHKAKSLLATNRENLQRQLQEEMITAAGITEKDVEETMEKVDESLAGILTGKTPRKSIDTGEQHDQHYKDMLEAAAQTRKGMKICDGMVFSPTYDKENRWIVRAFSNSINGITMKAECLLMPSGSHGRGQINFFHERSIKWVLEYPRKS